MSRTPTIDVTETAIIPASPQQVWAITAATDRYAEWVHGCLEVTANHGVATVGRTYSEVNELLGPLKARSTWTVAEADAPRYRCDRGVGFPILSDLESIFELTPHVTEGGLEQTELTYRVRYRVPDNALGRLFDRIQQPGVRAGMRQSLDALIALTAREAAAADVRAPGGMDVIAMGVHVLDVLVRPVEEIPAGQGGALVEQIKMTAAGSAGGTALTLAKLGARVRSAGATGTDPIGEMLRTMLARGGVDTSLLLRRDDVQTSASVLPIRPDGSRPALHVVGANGTYGSSDAPRQDIAAATHLHLGGPEIMGPEAAAEILAYARDHGVVTSVDLLFPGEMGTFDMLEPLLSYVDYLLPNDEQVVGFTGADSLLEGCRRLIAAGAGCVAATRGPDGVLLVDADRVQEIPAFDIEVVDTTGCGDAFSAGFMRAIALGRSPREAAVLGCSAAALVAQGLGSDHGDFDLAAADAFAATTPTRQLSPESSTT